MSFPELFYQEPLLCQLPDLQLGLFYDVHAMLFIRNFFTWSLFFTSIVLMLRWEITLLKHPEQFWEGSNDALKCDNCKDKICKFKKPKYFKK